MDEVLVMNIILHFFEYYYSVRVVQYKYGYQTQRYLRDTLPTGLFLLHCRYTVVLWVSDYHTNIDIFQVPKKTAHFREL